MSAREEAEAQRRRDWERARLDPISAFGQRPYESLDDLDARRDAERLEHAAGEVRAARRAEEEFKQTPEYRTAVAVEAAVPLLRDILAELRRRP